MTAVAYYIAPHETITRLLVVPASLTATLFPAFSALEGIKDREKLGILFARSVKYVLVSFGLLALVVALFAKELLQLWLGTDFSAQSTAVLQILVIGALFNSLAQVPSTLLSGGGRPDIPVKIHLLELPFYVALAWAIIPQWGIKGAATAWTLRVIVDAFLMFTFAFRTYRLPARVLNLNETKLTGAALLGLGASIYGLKKLIGFAPLELQALAVCILALLYIWLVWMWILDKSEQQAVRRAIGLRRG